MGTSAMTPLRNGLRLLSLCIVDTKQHTGWEECPDHVLGVPNEWKQLLLVSSQRGVKLRELYLTVCHMGMDVKTSWQHSAATCVLVKAELPAIEKHHHRDHQRCSCQAKSRSYWCGSGQERNLVHTGMIDKYASLLIRRLPVSLYWVWTGANQPPKPSKWK